VPSRAFSIKASPRCSSSAARPLGGGQRPVRRARPCRPGRHRVLWQPAWPVSPRRRRAHHRPSPAFFLPLGRVQGSRQNAAATWGGSTPRARASSNSLKPAGQTGYSIL